MRIKGNLDSKSSKGNPPTKKTGGRVNGYKRRARLTSKESI